MVTLNAPLAQRGSAGRAKCLRWRLPGTGQGLLWRAGSLFASATVVAVNSINFHRVRHAACCGLLTLTVARLAKAGSAPSSVPLFKTSYRASLSIGSTTTNGSNIARRRDRGRASLLAA
jgi:hypothetical protein